MDVSSLTFGDWSLRLAIEHAPQSQKLGTEVKYPEEIFKKKRKPLKTCLSCIVRRNLRFMASQKRVRYSSGDTTVGIFPCPPSMPDDLTKVSSRLSQVNVRM